MTTNQSPEGLADRLLPYMRGTKSAKADESALVPIDLLDEAVTALRSYTGEGDALLREAFRSNYLDHTGLCNAHDAGQCSCGFDEYFDRAFQFPDNHLFRTSDIIRNGVCVKSNPRASTSVETELEEAWRDGWAECKARLTDDEAFCLTEDVEEDAWVDSKTALALSNKDGEYAAMPQGPAWPRPDPTLPLRFTASISIERPIAPDPDAVLEEYERTVDRQIEAERDVDDESGFRLEDWLE